MSKEKKLEKLKQEIEDMREWIEFHQNKAEALVWDLEELETELADLEETKEEE